MLAKQYASKQAVDWLIKNGHMPGDGSVKFVVPTLLPLTEHELASEQKALQVLGGENWVGRLQGKVPYILNFWSATNSFEITAKHIESLYLTTKSTLSVKEPRDSNMPPLLPNLQIPLDVLNATTNRFPLFHLRS